MNFEQSVEYLYGLGNEVSAMKLGLENIKILLDALGNPEKNYRKVQVAGTNGKGSTCAFLEAICVSARIKTGLTISPHLISITERIKIGGREISEKDFARHASAIKETSEKLVVENKLETVPTFFEQVTAIALSAFSEAKIELAILETGLGGRFDAMTAARAELVAITPIDFDHEQILGNTIEQIASEKAAIIRADTKVVLAEQSSEAQTILSSVCAEFGITPSLGQTVVVGENHETLTANQIAETNANFQIRENKIRLNFKTPQAEYKNIRLSLRGRHQIENAKSAILLAEILRGDFKISPENIVEGLQNAVHKGRLEFYSGFLFDGAHNAAGAKALGKYLDELKIKKIILVFGAMKDKDLREIAAILFPRAAKIIFTEPDNSRSFKTSDLIKYLPKDFAGNMVFQTETVAEALNLARKISTEKDLICVTGSLYLVGEAQRELAEDARLRDL